ncbi:MAG: uroporphyrinogen-III synthase [Candidatus Nitrosocosmicus sp.]
MVENFGGKPYIAPTVGIEANLGKPNEAVIEFINRIVKQEAEYVIFMTGPGVFSLITLARNSGMEEALLASLKKTTVVARSAKPQMILRRFGIRADLIPQENTLKGILDLLKDRDITGKVIAILWHGNEQSTKIKEELYKAGASNIIEASSYRYSFETQKDGASILRSMGFQFLAPEEDKVIKLIEDIISGNIDAITFTSPPSVKDLFKIASIHHMNSSLKDSLNANVIVAAVGPSTREALEENGCHVDVMPQIFKMGPMIKSLCDYIDRDGISKSTKSSSRGEKLQ